MHGELVAGAGLTNANHLLFSFLIHDSGFPFCGRQQSDPPFAGPHVCPQMKAELPLPWFLQEVRSLDILFPGSLAYGDWVTGLKM